MDIDLGGQGTDELDNMFTDDMINQMTAGMELDFSDADKDLMSKLHGCSDPNQEKVVFGNQMLSDE